MYPVLIQLLYRFDYTCNDRIVYIEWIVFVPSLAGVGVINTGRGIMLTKFDLGGREDFTRGGYEEETGGGCALVYGSDEGGVGCGEEGGEDGLVDGHFAFEHWTALFVVK
jgi:hypothetical protein